MSLQRFRAPEFSLEYKRQIELNFSGNVAAGAHLSIVAGSIPYPFRIVQAKMIFTDDANNWIQHGWYIARDRGVSTTGPPSGENIFGRENPTAFFVGKALVKVVNTNIKIEERNWFIKMYTNNTGLYAYIANGSLIIQEL